VIYESLLTLADVRVEFPQFFLAIKFQLPQKLLGQDAGVAYKKGEGLSTRFYKLRKEQGLLHIEFQPFARHV